MGGTKPATTTVCAVYVAKLNLRTDCWMAPLVEMTLSAKACVTPKKAHIHVSFVTKHDVKRPLSDHSPQSSNSGRHGDRAFMLSQLKTGTLPWKQLAEYASAF